MFSNRDTADYLIFHRDCSDGSRNNQKNTDQPLEEISFFPGNVARIHLPDLRAPDEQGEDPLK